VVKEEVTREQLLADCHRMAEAMQQARLILFPVMSGLRMWIEDNADADGLEYVLMHVSDILDDARKPQRDMQYRQRVKTSHGPDLVLLRAISGTPESPIAEGK
jgi:hypothetical protein